MLKRVILTLLAIFFCAILSIVIILYWILSNDIQGPLNNPVQTQQYQNNKITLLINGVNSNAARLKNIAEADTILIKTFEFHDDETGKTLGKILAEKANSGAKVFVQFDVKGTRHSPEEIKQIWQGEENSLPPVLRDLAEAGKNNVFIIPTNIPVGFSEYIKSLLGIYTPNDHEKYLITWNSKNVAAPVKVIMGGLNIGDEYLFGGTTDDKGNLRIVPRYNAFAFRDTDIEVIGPVVQDIVKRYVAAADFQSQNKNSYYRAHQYDRVIDAISQLKMLNAKMDANKAAAFPANAGSANARLVAKGIHQRDIERTLIDLIATLPAGETLRLITPFFLPTPELQNAMLSAEARGVKFKVLNNGLDSVDDSFVTLVQAAHCRYRYLYLHAKKNGFQFYEWHGNKKMGVSSLHEKVFSVGSDKLSPFIIGSSNMDSQSLIHDSEDILVIQDPELKPKFDTMIDNDFNQPDVQLLTLEALTRESLSDKFNQCFYDWVLHSNL